MIQYADDVCSSTSKVSEGLTSLERSVNAIEVLDPLGLCLSAAKTQLCVFSRGDRKLLEPVYMGGRLVCRRQTFWITVMGTKVFS